MNGESSCKQIVYTWKKTGHLSLVDDKLCKTLVLSQIL